MFKPPIQKNLTEQIRQIVVASGEVGATLDHIYVMLDIVDPKIKKKVANRLHDMVHKSKEMVRVKRGLYRSVKKDPGTDRLPVAEKIWKLLRIRHKKGAAVTTDDLVSICGATNQYAREKMRAFTRAGIVKKTGHRSWKMIAEPVVMPKDVEKAKKLAAIRAGKLKTVLAALDQLTAASIDARMAISDLAALDQ